MTPFVILSLVASAFAAPQVRKQLSVVNVMVALLWQVTESPSCHHHILIFSPQLPAGLTAAACPNYPYCDAT